MKKIIKQISALGCAVLLAISSVVPAFADTSETAPTSDYFNLVETNSEISFNTIDDIYDKLNIDYFPVHSYTTTTTGYSYRNFENHENWLNSSSADDLNKFIVYYTNSTNNVVVECYIYRKSECEIYYDGTNYVLQSINGLTTNNYIMSRLTCELQEDNTYLANVDVGATINNVNGTMAVLSSIIKTPNSDKCTVINAVSSNADILDSEGNVVITDNSKPNIVFTIEPTTTFDNDGITECYFDFRIESDKNIYCMLELYEGDTDSAIANGQLWVNNYKLGQYFTPSHTPVYRYNYSENLSEKQKVNVSLSYSKMLNREYPDQINWWVEFFKNDKYSASNGVTDDDLNSVISALENRDDWVTYWTTVKGSSKPAYTAEKVYEFLKYRTTDKFFNFDLFLGNFGNALEERAKNSIQTISAYAHDMENKKMYNASIMVIGGSYKHGTIYANNIDYEPNKNYYWVLTYEILDVMDTTPITEKYLTNPRFAYYSIWYAPNQKLNYEPLSYGNGLSGQQNIYDENGNLFGTMNDNIVDVNPNNDLIVNEFGNISFDTSSLDSLFNSSTGFFDFLSKGFSIFPSFIWLIIAGFITVLIFLRVMGR